MRRKIKKSELFVLDTFLWRIILSSFYFLLIQNGQTVDIVVGIVCAIAVALLEAKMQKMNLIPLKVKINWFKKIIRLPSLLIKDTVQLINILLVRIIKNKKVRGNIYWVPFKNISGHKESITRRVLITMALSALPNSYIIGFDNRKRKVLIHELNLSHKDLKLPL
jgi:multisubunit Na+/H+ antiporter MnhE subunit